MFRGRTPRTAAILRRAVPSFVESLEERRLLTTLHENESFTFYDAEENRFRVSTTGTHIDVELIGARVTVGQQVIIRDLVAPPVEGGPDVDGVNLFQIYIAGASADAQLTITQVNEDGEAIPYTGNPGEMRPGFGTTATPSGGGAAYIGARSADNPDIDEDDHVPIIFNNRRTGLGIRPAGTPYWAGIQTAPGVSLNKIYIDGIVTGIVNIQGSLREFYAADVGTGVFPSSVSPVTSISNNFQVAGDLQNFLVRGSFGAIEGVSDTGGVNGNPEFTTNSQLRVGGRLGNVIVGGDWAGTVVVVNSPDVPDPINTPFEEPDYHPFNAEDRVLQFEAGVISDPIFYNDVATSRFYGYSYTSETTGISETIEFDGTILGPAPFNDVSDFYSLPLMAGQSIAVHLVDPTTGLSSASSLNVVDPLGQSVASNAADAAGFGQGDQFLLTAKVPGVYRFEITGGADYRLRIQGVGAVALGGMHISGNTLIGNGDAGVGISVVRGDFGGLRSDANIFSDNSVSPLSVARGNIRALSGANIGRVGNAILPLDLLAPRGSVGHVFADGILSINGGAIDFDGEPIVENAVGFDYQRVESGGDLQSYLTAKRGIGSVIVGGNILGVGGTQAHLYANADRLGQDGRIDFIDVAGDFGNSDAAARQYGPALFTGLGGNVGYVRCQGTVVPDGFFGGSIDNTIDLTAGKVLSYTDDSGVGVRVVPTTVSTTTNGVTTRTAGALTGIELYSVRESGGQVLMNVTSSTSMAVYTVDGVTPVDIGEITTSGTGSAVSYNATTRAIGYAGTTAGTIVRSPAIANAITFGGTAPINVLSLTGNNITGITNATSGEIVGIQAASIGYLQAQSVGVGHGQVAGNLFIPSNLGTAFPFNPFSYGVNVTGSVISLSTREECGPISVTGTLGTLAPNSDGRNNANVFEGLTAPVLAGVILNADVGEGIPTYGSGGVVQSGIFASDEIRSLRARNADIRGYVGAINRIASIRIENGSLIGARVGVIADLATLVPGNTMTLNDLQFATNGTVVTTLPDYSLDTLSVVGNGGIIGSQIFAADFRGIDVRDGFGILNSLIGSTTGFNPSGSITTDGLGMRGLSVNAGQSLNKIEARGDGKRLNLLSYDSTVTQSTRRKFDPTTGRQFTGSNDIFRATRSLTTQPTASGKTNSGIIENSTFIGQNELGSLKGYLIRAYQADPDFPVPPSNILFPMRVSFASRVRKLDAVNAINGLQVRTANLEQLSSGGNMDNVDVRTSGKIGLVASGRGIRGTTSFLARGPNASIDRFIVKQTMFATVVSDNGINTVNVGNLGSNMTTLNKIANLTVRGDVLTGAYVRATKGIGTLFVGGDVQLGATISAKSYASKTILGNIDGSVVTT